MAVLDQAGRGAPSAVARMPQPTIRMRLPMRDGVRLDTWIWLPERIAQPVPAILQRTPYQEHVMGWERLGTLRYRDAGYALIVQVIRGVGTSDGEYTFNSPSDRTDGYDTIEWLARQDWCDGAIGMDGGSYVAMTQLTAASERPPHLKCILLSVPAAHGFKDSPYFGGIFSRLHTINWTNLISIERIEDLKGGFASAMPILSQPEWLARMISRPVKDAADGVLKGDKLKHYRDVLTHSTYDDWWRARTTTDEDYARISVPALVISGSFEITAAALNVWRGLEANDSTRSDRCLLIGPWDHGQSYVGGAERHGPYELGSESTVDLHALRLAFFDRHLKGQGEGPDLGGRVKLFVTGVNRWLTFDRYPPAQVDIRMLYLRSRGSANSVRGDGRLDLERNVADEPPDRFISDPALPYVAALASATGEVPPFDMREIERSHDVLVYTSDTLEIPWTILGEPVIRLTVAADAPDCDLFVWMVEQRGDGQSVRLAWGGLRLRYREGFEREILLEPGQPVAVHIPLTYIAHQLPIGSRLRLVVGSSNFPLWDPNPNTGEAIADAVEMRAAEISIFHDAGCCSRVELPVLPSQLLKSHASGVATWRSRAESSISQKSRPQ